MTTATITTLPTPRKQPRRPAGKATKVASEPRPSSPRRKLAIASACCIGAGAIAATALSLSDLAESIMNVAHIAPWKGYALATAIDFNFISTEAFSLFTTAAIARETRWSVTSTKVVTLAMSGVANAYAMAHGAESTIMQGVFVVAGFAIPALVAMATSTLGKAVRG